MVKKEEKNYNFAKVTVAKSIITNDAPANCILCFPFSLIMKNNALLELVL
jgi:hypothetical protein